MEARTLSPWSDGTFTCRLIVRNYSMAKCKPLYFSHRQIIRARLAMTAFGAVTQLSSWASAPSGETAGGAAGG